MSASKCLVTACAVVMLGSCVKDPADPLKPNIVFILADDLSYRDLSCYGQEVYQKKVSRTSESNQMLPVNRSNGL